LWTAAASYWRTNIAQNVEQSNFGSFALPASPPPVCLVRDFTAAKWASNSHRVATIFPSKSPLGGCGIAIQPWRSHLLTAYRVCWSPFHPALPGRRSPLNHHCTSLRRSSLPARPTLLSTFSPSLMRHMQLPALSSMTVIM